MLEETSRYTHLESAELTLPDGRQVRYRRRRFLPQGESLPLLLEVNVTEGERLDQIAARTLGDPEQAWRIADANNAMHPLDLLTEPGRTLRIPLPEAEG